MDKSELGDRLGYNPYRGEDGKFQDGPQLLESRGRKKIPVEDQRRKIDAAKERLKSQYQIENPKEEREKVLEGPKYIDTVGFAVADDNVTQLQKFTILWKEREVFPGTTYESYYSDEKKQAGDMFMMTPAEYRFALIEGKQYKNLDEIEKRMDWKKVESFRDDMQSGDKFPPPSLTYAEDGDVVQEGLHRMYAAEEVGIERVPTAVVYSTENKDIYPYNELSEHILSDEDLHTEDDEPEFQLIEEMPKIGEDAVEEVPESVAEEPEDKAPSRSIASRDFEGLYDDTGIDTDNMGAIMMKTEALSVSEFVESPEPDLYEETDYNQGALPAETTPHLTLIYGLLENGNNWKEKVDRLLEGWSLPSVTIEHVDYFDTPDSYAVVAKLEPTPELVEGHNRLTLLPHVNTFSEYEPHITLAYVNKDADVQKWVDALNAKYAGQEVKTVGIDYGDPAEEEEEEKTENALVGQEHNSLSPGMLELTKNNFDQASLDILKSQENALENGFEALERDILEATVNNVSRNYLEEPSDVLSSAQRKRFEQEAQALLTTFYTNLYPVFGRQILSHRASEFGVTSPYTMTEDMQAYIEEMAQKAAVSHVNTVVSDILTAASIVYAGLVIAALITLVAGAVAVGDMSVLAKLPENPSDEDIERAVRAGKFDSTDLYKEAQKKARDGASQQEIVNAIRSKYPTITENRAKTIARTESARVFNQSQYQADRQFLINNNMLDKAYKRLVSRTGNPCSYCKALIDKPAIPFTQNFAELGTEITAMETTADGQTKVKKLPVNWEAVSAGNVHPNCNCHYELIIRDK